LLISLALATGASTGASPRRAARTAADCTRTSTGLRALTDLGTGTYRGFSGGLYPGGSNTPPAEYAQRGLTAAGRITPRAANGQASPTGRIVLLSIGMSNVLTEFNAFGRLEATDGGVDQSLLLVNGAQAGQDAEAIKDPSAPYWSFVAGQLSKAGVTAAQVQIVWLKEAIARENEPFPTDANRLQQDLDAIVSVLRQRFPNLQIVYLASRTYGGYASIPLNPEPFAYESGFAVKGLIQAAIAAPAQRPWLAWGPYIWTDGLRGRGDGLVWTCDDVQSDGTHPSATGSAKIGHLLHAFFTSDPTATPWFTR